MLSGSLILNLTALNKVDQPVQSSKVDMIVVIVRCHIVPLVTFPTPLV